METSFKLFSGAASALAALFAPITPLMGCAMTFILIDFLSGVAADRHRTRREGKPWFFESHRAWRTITKAGFVWIAIALAWLLESCVLDFAGLKLARVFTGFVCGVELWSFLENAAELSDGPLFRALKRIARRRIRKEVEDE